MITPLAVITLESPRKDSNTEFEANVADNGISPPVISFAKQAISGTQCSSSAAVYKEPIVLVTPLTLLAPTRK